MNIAFIYSFMVFPAKLETPPEPSQAHKANAQGKMKHIAKMKLKNFLFIISSQSTYVSYDIFSIAQIF